MTAEELKDCVKNHPKNQSQIASDLGISTSGFSKWIKGTRKIDDRDTKLLRLYFYGEIPFEDIRPPQDLSSILKFSEQEWGIIKILALRVGMDAPQWIAEQVRTIIAFRSSESTDRPQTHLRTYTPPSPRATVLNEGAPTYESKVIDPAQDALDEANDAGGEDNTTAEA